MRDDRLLSRYLGDGDTRFRLLLFVVNGCVALGLGFVWISIEGARAIITHAGYYYILILFALFLYYLGKCRIFPHRNVWRRRGFAWGAATVALGTCFAIWSDPFQHKILFDEYVLQATAYHMHATKEVGTLYRAYFIEGTWLPISSFLDKRPYFFAFLVSLLHDLSGYRLANIFILNVFLTPVFLGSLYWLALRLAGVGGACFGVLLVATMPLFAQQTSGAGMELHNLTMLSLTICLAIFYLRQPTNDRLALLLITAVLLSQSRYESVSFIFPTALVAVLGWVKVGRVILPPVAIAAPLLLIPYALHNRVLAATPFLWQLGAGQTSRFALKYFPGAVAGAWKFFSNANGYLADSWVLALTGVIGLLVAGVILGRRWAAGGHRLARLVNGEEAVILVYGLTIAGNFGMLMFYYWSRLDDVIASRFSLPVYFIFALLSARLFVRRQVLGISAYKWVGASFMVWLFGFGIPAASKRLYTDQNVGMLEIAWQHDVLEHVEQPILLVTNTSTIPFILWKIPTIVMGVARSRARELAFHFHAGTFQKVYVAQSLRATSAQGDMGVDSDDILPKSFHLRTVALKRFGSRWSRLSEVISIDPEEAKPTSAPEIVGPSAAGRVTQE